MSAVESNQAHGLEYRSAGLHIARRLWNSRTFTSWASVGTRGLSLLLVLPLLLKRLEPSEVAVWYLIATVISLQGLADIGFAPTFTRVLAYAMGGAKELRLVRQDPESGERRGAPNWDLVGTIWHSMWRVYLWLTVASCLVVAVGGTLAMARPIRALPVPEVGWIAWTVVVAISGVALWGNAYSAYLQGVDEVVLVRRWDALMSLGGILTSFIVLLAGGRLLPLVIANQAWVVAAVARNWQLAHVVHGGRFRSLKSGDRTGVIKVVWPSAWRSGVGVAMSRGVAQATGLAFAQIGSSVAVASYLIALRIIQLVSDFSVAPLGSQLPVWARLRGQNRTGELLASGQRTMRVTYWTFALAFVSIGVAGPVLFRAMGSHTPFVNGAVWGLLGLAFFLERYGAAHLQLYSTTNHIIWHVANGVTGLIIIAVIFALVTRLGVYAFPIAFLAGYGGFYAWYTVVHSYRHDAIKVFAFERTTVLPPLLVVVAYTVFSLVVGRA